MTTATPSAEGLEPCLRCAGILSLHENDWAAPPLWSFRCHLCGLSGKEWLYKDQAIADANRRPSAPARADIRREEVATEIERYRDGLIDEYKIVCDWLAAHFRALSDQPVDTVRAELVEALKLSKRSLTVASRMLTDACKPVLDGRRWGDDTLNKIDAALSRAESTEGR